jgi:hypothetical protein
MYIYIYIYRVVLYNIVFKSISNFLMLDAFAYRSQNHMGVLERTLNPIRTDTCRYFMKCLPTRELAYL